MIRKLCLSLAVVGMFAGATAANADPVINNTGITSPAETITFSEVPLAEGTPVTNQFASLGVTFSPTLYYDLQAEFFPTDFLANFDDNGDTNDPATIFFANDQTAAAFALQTNPGTTTFEALLNGVEVESFTASTDLSFLPDLTNASNFYGFSGIVFNEIMVTPNNEYAFQLDNLQLSNAATAVPEPGTLALFGVALAGLAVFYRRKPTRLSRSATL